VPGPDTNVVGAALVAYSLGPGLEFIPYFLGLLTWAALAFAAIFLSPMTAFVRRLWRICRGDPQRALTEKSKIRNSKSETNPKSE
jgi:hypothetical protein